MLPAEESLSFTKQNVHAFLLVCRIYWEKHKEQSNHLTTKYEYPQTLGYFHFWKLVPKQWVVLRQTCLLLLYSVSGFSTLTVALWTTAHWLWLQFLLLSRGSWEHGFCRDFVVWESTLSLFPSHSHSIFISFGVETECWYVAQTGLKLTMFLLILPERDWEHKPVP